MKTYNIYVTIDKKTKKIIDFSGLRQNDDQIELVFEENSENFYMYEKFLIPDINFISKLIIKKYKNYCNIEIEEAKKPKTNEVDYSNLDDIIIF